MRVFCLTFIVFILLLLTQPCQDMIATADYCGRGETQIAHVDRTSPGDSESEECMPFCICSCCSHPVANHKFSFAATSDPSVGSAATTRIEYTNPYTDAYRNSIWQPPKA